MKRRAIGLTAAPEYPEIEDLPFTTGIAVMFSISIFVIAFTVLMAAIPAAPPSIEAIAGISIFPMFGVILAMTGRCVAAVTTSQ